MKTVLLADDSQFMRSWLTKMVTAANFLVIAEARNGEEAIIKYKEIKPDIVIMDITMPGVDGLEALEEIIKFDPLANIVMCSAIGQQSFIIDSLKLGACDFLVKPHFKHIQSTLERIHTTHSGSLTSRVGR
ncbi:response regulator [Mesobacillus harenae]|uniref:response regulator n=1 Tax=Mesobacillus harenae TaxID=2213203 RepID=UPI0015810434|nr:response regulator [Mesobacillus harenae]